MPFHAAEAAACNARGHRNPVNLVPAGSSSRMASWARARESVRFTARRYGGHVASQGTRVRGAAGLVGTCATGLKQYQSDIMGSYVWSILHLHKPVSNASTTKM
jgi:hypothetical protein